jgi:hypothetical protein
MYKFPEFVTEHIQSFQIMTPRMQVYLYKRALLDQCSSYTDPMLRHVMKTLQLTDKLIVLLLLAALTISADPWWLIAGCFECAVR